MPAVQSLHCPFSPLGFRSSMARSQHVRCLLEARGSTAQHCDLTAIRMHSASWSHAWELRPARALLDYDHVHARFFKPLASFLPIGGQPGGEAGDDEDAQIAAVVAT